MWYAASLLFKSVKESSDEPSLWEESIRLVRADTDAEAHEKAVRLGRSAETSYEADGSLVTWSFDRVERIYAIEGVQVEDGTELFSRHLRDSEVRSLLTPFDDE
jgi:hypothetical protein